MGKGQDTTGMESLKISSMSASSPPKPSFHNQSPPNGGGRGKGGGEWELPLRTGVTTSPPAPLQTKNNSSSSSSASSSSSSPSPTRSETTTNISTLLLEEPRSYVHKLELVDRLKKEIKKLRESLKEKERMFKAKESSFHKDLSMKDVHEHSLNAKIASLEESNRKLHSTVERQAREEKKNALLSATIEEHRHHELLQGTEITNLKDMIGTLKEQNEDSRQSLKTLQEAHTDLVQRLKTELQQERDARVQLEAKITEKDKSFDKFKQDQREICDELHEKNRELEKQVSALTASRLEGMKKNVRSIMKRCLATSAEDKLAWSFGTWRDDYRGAKERERVVTQRVKMVLEYRFTSTASQRLTWGFQTWKGVVGQQREKEKIKNRVRIALEQRFMTSVYDQKVWVLKTFKNALDDARRREAMLKQSIELDQSVADKCKDKVDSSMQDIEGGEVEEENDDDGDECYNMSVSRLLSSHVKNRGCFSGHHNHSSSSDRKRRDNHNRIHEYNRHTVGVKINTPLLDELCTKYGVR